MQLETLQKLLSPKQLNLISIISDQLQKNPSATDLNSQQLSKQSQMPEGELQETIDTIGEQYGRRLTASTIRFNLKIIELNAQLQSKPVIDYHAKVEAAWKTNRVLGVSGGLLALAILMIGGYAILKPAIDAALNWLFQ